MKKDKHSIKKWMRTWNINSQKDKYREIHCSLIYNNPFVKIKLLQWRDLLTKLWWAAIKKNGMELHLLEVPKNVYTL